MRHHGRLSKACRYPGRYATSLGSVYAEVKGLFPIRVYLRNGPRILRACDTVQAEVDAAQRPTAAQMDADMEIMWAEVEAERAQPH